MNEENKNYVDDTDSLKEIIEFQNNMFNPGYYVGTGKVPPTVKATGNALPLAVMYFIGAIMWLSLGLYLFFSDAEIVFLGFIKSEQADKIITLIVMLLVSLFFVYLGFIYLKKAKKYYKNKTKMKNEITDETVQDELWQRTCPKCGKSHDIDYPKCPYCKFDYVGKQH